MIDFIYDTLASLGFSHPLHPAMTHIPMGMIIGGFLFAATAVVLNKKDLAQAAHYCFTLALIFVPPTIVLGLMDWQHKFYGEWSGLIVAKLVLAALLTGMLVLTFFLGRNPEMDMKKKLVLYAVCLVIATGLGFSGGELQYG